jgi:hypothetical protein
MKRALFLAVTLLALGCGPADEAPPPDSRPEPTAPAVAAREPLPTADLSSPAGVWEGSIDFPAGPLVLVISLAQAADGAWHGVLEAPTGGQAPPDLENLAVSGTRVAFQVGVGGETLRAEGVMSGNGRFLGGDATRNSVTAPFLLLRTAAPAALP